MTARARHRVGQFAGALRPRIDEAARTEAYTSLNAAQRALFETMMPRDQQHGIDVFLRVSTSSDDPALLVAALLHDCGKGRIALWQRVAHVLLPPAARRAIASERGGHWRQAMWRLEHHPALGAELVARTGADPETVRMIREQDAPSPDERLALLQAADEA